MISEWYPNSNEPIARAIEAYEYAIAQVIEAFGKADASFSRRVCPP